MNHEDFMRIAIEEAKKGDFPFGAVIIKDNGVVAKGYNSIKRDSDPTAHAEMNVIRKLTTKIKDRSLKGYTLYSTCEPCPMCAGACIWAGISKIVFGVSIKDIMDSRKEIDLSCEDVIAKGFTKIDVIKGVLKEECMNLYKS